MFFYQRYSFCAKTLQILLFRGILPYRFLPRLRKPYCLLPRVLSVSYTHLDVYKRQVDDYGNVISSYAKIHPYSHGVEAKYFTGGDRIEWFNLKGATVSPFICYDMRFPEIFQIASQKSRLIIVSASWPDIRSPQYDILIRARAIETQSFIAIVNRVGHEMKYNYNGHSQIVSPDGNVISTISESEALITAEFDINYADVCRHNFSVKSDRRPDLYKKYL